MNNKMPKIYALKILSIPLQTLILGFFLTSDGLLAQKLPLSQNLINLNSVEGENLLIESQYRQDFLPLISQFVTQKNQAYCGVASSVMVLNSLSIQSPVAPEYAPYRVFTQDNFFNEQTQQVIAKEVVARQGMTLEQLGKLLESHAVKAEVYHAGDVTLEEFRRLTSKNLQESGNFVIVNYLRKAISQETGGHISPLAAYNKETDRFLILDVTRYKYPPVWVKASELWKAMATIDLVSGKTRGFVLVSQP
jgi:hypothetical protein